jgi:coenzyme F420 hydrogenase subunit beta
VVVRTEKGRAIIHDAIHAGYLSLKPAERWKLEKSQGGLLQKKGSVWGRRLALRLLGLPVTQFKGLDLFHCWQRLSLLQKVKSVFGTLRRVLQRRYYRRYTR